MKVFFFTLIIVNLIKPKNKKWPLKQPVIQILFFQQPIRPFTENLDEYRPDSKSKTTGSLGDDVRSSPFAMAKDLFDGLAISMPHGVSLKIQGVLGSMQVVAFMPRSEKGSSKNLFDKPTYEPPSEQMTYIFNSELVSVLQRANQPEQVALNGRRFHSVIPTVNMVFDRASKAKQRKADKESIPSESKSAAFNFPIVRTYDGESAARLIFSFEEICLGVADVILEPVPKNLISRKMVKLAMHHPKVGDQLAKDGQKRLLEKFPSGYYIELISSELNGTLTVHRSYLSSSGRKKLEAGQDFLWENNRVYQYDQAAQHLELEENEQIAPGTVSAIKGATQKGGRFPPPSNGTLHLLSAVAEVEEPEEES